MNAFLKPRIVLPFVAAIVAVLMLCTSAFGQCSMCRAALGGSNNAFFIRNFNIGVLVLLLPPVTIFCSIFIVLKRYRRSDSEDRADKHHESGNADPE
jgi:hypothetical protein